MTTLTGFTRPADPIVELGLEAKILADTGLVVTTLINPTTIDVTGASISSGNTAAIQTSISSYVYTNPIGDPTKVNITAIESASNMGGSSTAVPSSYTALAGDTTVYNATRNRAYINGTLTYDVIAWLDTATTNASGVATFYLTSTHAAGGAAIFSSIYSYGVVATPYGPDAYQEAVVSISGSTVTVTVTKAVVTLGIITTSTAANGITVTLNVMGKP